MNWQDKTTVKKGNIGEEICRNLLEGQGFVVYNPVTDAAHVIDFFCHKSNKELIAAEVKTKRRTLKNYWYRDSKVKSKGIAAPELIGIPGTGFNRKSAKEYWHLHKKHNIDVVLFFVDDFEGCIYGGRFSKLLHYGTKMKTADQVVFPLDKMNVFCRLSTHEKNLIASITNCKYDYSSHSPFFNQTELPL